MNPSLAGMLQRAFGYRLDKSLQRTDWLRRPLPPAMVAYAARDAEVTLALYYWLDTHYHTILKMHEYMEEPLPRCRLDRAIFVWYCASVGRDGGEMKPKSRDSFKIRHR